MISFDIVFFLKIWGYNYITFQIPTKFPQINTAKTNRVTQWHSCMKTNQDHRKSGQSSKTWPDNVCAKPVIIDIILKTDTYVEKYWNKKTAVKEYTNRHANIHFDCKRCLQICPNCSTIILYLWPYKD
jgi:hypothetical protein